MISIQTQPCSVLRDVTNLSCSPEMLQVHDSHFPLISSVKSKGSYCSWPAVESTKSRQRAPASRSPSAITYPPGSGQHSVTARHSKAAVNSTHWPAENHSQDEAVKGSPCCSILRGVEGHQWKEETSSPPAACAGSSAKFQSNRIHDGAVRPSQQKQDVPDAHAHPLEPPSVESGTGSARSPKASSSDTRFRQWEPPSNEEERAALMSRLTELKCLFTDHRIAKEDYEDESALIVDLLTGTRHRQPKGTAFRVKTSARSPTKAPRGPPNFARIEAVPAVQHCFDPEKRRWSRQHVLVKLDRCPFARGGMRKAYYVEMSCAPSSNCPADRFVGVAKIFVNPDERKAFTFQDVEVQKYASQFADKYNSYNPPKKVQFLNCDVLEFSLNEREPPTYYSLEPIIQGSFRKHNNNFGFVETEDERNTPHAFSHFTYEASKHTLVICDIQGVGDIYTDPQLHTTEEDEIIGSGNFGRRGIQKFLESHKCNAVCKYLKLPKINPKLSVEDVGTVAIQPEMDRTRVRPHYVYKSTFVLPEQQRSCMHCAIL